MRPKKKMLAKSLKKIDMRPTALVPVITKMWRPIEPVTKRGPGPGWGRDAVDGVLAPMGSLSAVRGPCATQIASGPLPASVGSVDQTRALERRARAEKERPMGLATRALFSWASLLQPFTRRMPTSQGPSETPPPPHVLHLGRGR